MSQAVLVRRRVESHFSRCAHGPRNSNRIHRSEHVAGTHPRELSYRDGGGDVHMLAGHAIVTACPVSFSAFVFNDSAYAYKRCPLSLIWAKCDRSHVQMIAISTPRWFHCAQYVDGVQPCNLLLLGWWR
jgi:hypothetical protein